MDKFKNIDLVSALRSIMETNTVNYKTDFDIDIDTLKKTAQKTDPDEKVMMWLSRPSGTECQPERQVFQKDSRGHNNWRFYDEQTSDRILAYAVEVKSYDSESDTVYGNLYELDYHSHVDRVCNLSVASNNVTVFFENGGNKRMDKKQYFDASAGDFPDILYFRNEPNSPDKLKSIQQNELNKREESCVEGNFHDHVQRLELGRYEFEAAQIMSELDKLEKPNSPNRKDFIVPISGVFATFAQHWDWKKLMEALPYKSATIATFRDGNQTYAVVDGKEMLRSRGQLKPSIADRLKGNHTPHAEAKHKKQNGLEM